MPDPTYAESQFAAAFVAAAVGLCHSCGGRPGRGLPPWSEGAGFALGI